MDLMGNAMLATIVVGGKILLVPSGTNRERDKERWKATRLCMSTQQSGWKVGWVYRRSAQRRRTKWLRGQQQTIHQTANGKNKGKAGEYITNRKLRLLSDTSKFMDQENMQWVTHNHITGFMVIIKCKWPHQPYAHSSSFMWTHTKL